MGEYAQRNSDHERIKIGTCENMYYLRADQVQKVTGLPGNVSPISELGLRFRFPFPSEDGVAPGNFEDYSKSYPVPGLGGQQFIGHGKLQFVSGSPSGWNVCLPCPNGNEAQPEGIKVHRNGGVADLGVVWQKRVGDGLHVVVSCPACGASWSLDREEAADMVATPLRATEQEMAITIADRVMAGYDQA